MLDEIEIYDLLFKNHYVLKLNKNDNQLIILHGDNGSGKTTFLKIIYSIINNKFQQLNNLNYRKINFSFKDNTVITFYNDNTGEILTNGKFSDFELKDTFLSYDEELKNNLIKSPDGLKKLLNDSDIWFSEDNDSEFPFRNKKTGELIRNAPLNIQELDGILKQIKKLTVNSELYYSYMDKINCEFIKTNRLAIAPIKVHNDPIYHELVGSRIRSRLRFINTTNHPLEDLQKDLKTRIRRANEDFTQYSRSFDQTFFDVLIDEIKKASETTNIQEIKNNLSTELENIDSEERELISLGIFETSYQGETERAKRILKENDDTIIKMYSAIKVFNKGLRRKFEIYSELKNKVSNLNKFITKHLIGKKIIFSTNSGLEFKTDEGKNISLLNLSSGEQHIVLLAYHLSFKLKPNSIVLIDEPEISLHLKWQRTFIQDILELSKEANPQFIIATHSPAISSPFEKCMYRLGKGRK